MFKKIALLFSVAMIAGCSTNHDWQKFMLEDTEKKVTLISNYDEIARKRITTELKDPASTTISRFSGPKIGMFKPLLSENVYGYAVCYNVNTKNSFGQYTGNRLHLFIFKNEGIAWQSSQNGLDILQDGRIADTCKAVL